MTIRNLCVRELDSAIRLSEELKISIKRGNYRIAINQIADLLFVIGQSLTCINRAEFNQSVLRVKPSKTSNVRSQGTPTGKTSMANISNIGKAQCLQLVDAAIANFQKAKSLVRAGRYEDAENVIVATLTGKILRCVNSLR